MKSFAKAKRRTTFTPSGWQTITPRLHIDDPLGLCRFLRKVFKATGRYQQSRPTELRIGDSRLLISGTEVRAMATGVFYVYVSNADATYKRALAAGASSIEEPIETPYGDRRCIVTDVWGNTWQIATFRRR
jgi:uncharacterized glyoxalase superfamily protein PhnB